MKFRVVGFSVLGTALLVAVGLALFAFDFPRVRTNDMAPGLRTGDLVLACRICGQPQPGDVVIFANSGEEAGEEKFSMRRVVAGPGDKIEVRKGQVLVNGQPLLDEKQEEIEIPNLDEVSATGRKFEVYAETLGKHHYRVIRDVHIAPTGELPPETLKNDYFVLADRRTFARDSRQYGPVPKAQIRSIVKRVLTAGDKDSARQTNLP
jgi:signal peptidase I